MPPGGSDWHPRKLGGKARAESLHFFSTEPLFLIPFGSLPAVQEVTSGASESFRRNQFSSCPGDRTARGSRRSGSQSRCTFSRRNHFSSFLPAQIGRRRKPGGRPAGSLHFFSTEPLFLIPPAQISGSLKPRDRGSQRASLRFCSRSPFLILFNSPETLGRTRAFSRSAFVSSSLHGDSGIPVVPKTGASPPRLLPPTS